MPAYVVPRGGQNNIGSALAGIASTYANATAQRDQREANQQVRDAQIRQSDSATQKALEEAAGLRLRNESFGNLASQFEGVEETGIPGLSGANLGAIAQNVNDKELDDFVNALRDAGLKAQANQNFDSNPSKAAFQANLGGAKIDDQFSQNSSGQVLSNFGGETQQTALSRSEIGQNNASANLDRAKTTQVGVEKPLSPIQQAQLEKTQLEVGALQDKNASAERQRQNAIDSAVFKADRTRGLVGDAKNLVGGNTAGPVGALLSNIPGFESFDLAQKIQTINSNLGIDELLRIKSEGGTFGALSDRELTTLQTSIANLNQAQSPEQLRGQLDVIDQNYARLIQSLGDEQGGPPTNENSVSDPLAEARAAIQSGAPREAVIQRLQENGIDASGL